MSDDLEKIVDMLDKATKGAQSGTGIAVGGVRIDLGPDAVIRFLNCERIFIEGELSRMGVILP